MKYLIKISRVIVARLPGYFLYRIVGTCGSFTTYYGKAQAVIRADKAGTIRITASGSDMGSAFAEIKTVDKNMI